jgi:hypothetical protein
MKTRVVVLRAIVSPAFASQRGAAAWAAAGMDPTAAAASAAVTAARRDRRVGTELS